MFIIRNKNNKLKNGYCPSVQKTYSMLFISSYMEGLVHDKDWQVTLFNKFKKLHMLWKLINK